MRSRTGRPFNPCDRDGSSIAHNRRSAATLEADPDRALYSVVDGATRIYSFNPSLSTRSIYAYPFGYDFRDLEANQGVVAALENSNTPRVRLFATGIERDSLAVDTVALTSRKHIQGGATDDELLGIQSNGCLLKAPVLED